MQIQDVRLSGLKKVLLVSFSILLSKYNGCRLLLQLHADFSGLPLEKFRPCQLLELKASIFSSSNGISFIEASLSAICIQHLQGPLRGNCKPVHVEDEVRKYLYVSRCRTQLHSTSKATGKGRSYFDLHYDSSS